MRHHKRSFGLLAVAALGLGAALVVPARAGADDAGGAPAAGEGGIVDVGATGFAIKRPVLASACENGCPWGELGDFVTEAMQPLGYDVVQCRNCDQDRGPPLVSKAGRPPPIGITDTFVGTTTTVNAPVDFGITEIGFLEWGYAGRYTYASSGPYASGTPGPFTNLRLIAKIEDVTYLLVAVKASSGITDLSQIAQKKMAVTILGGGSPISQPVLDYYGLTQSAVTSWGGLYANAIVAGTEQSPSFDVIVNELGSPANNPESEIWEKASQANDLLFLDLPSAVLDKLAGDKTLGLTRATVKYGLLRGVDRPIATVARSGHAVFARDDMPEQAAYDTAKAIDQHRDALKWYIRPYAYDSRTVWQDATVPLHPGAQRYYKEMGYLQGSGGGTCPPAATGGCSAAGQNVALQWLGALATALTALAARRARRGGSR
jgi:TRAP transporter TAXI family solute receptor